MATPTFTPTLRSILTTDDVSEDVLKARPRGDRLRISRKNAPQPDRLDNIVAAETAVAESARILENALRDHQDNLDHLNKLRQRHDLPETAGPAIPEPAAVPAAPQDGYLIGRITGRAPLTACTKTSGTLTLTSGEAIRWTAGASYVDALEALFGGVPVQVKGVFTAPGVLSIENVLPAPRPFWGDGEDYDAFAEVGPITVMAASVLRKRLRKQHGALCQRCGAPLPKRADGSIVDLAAGPVLFCRPCKQGWVDAGRPTKDADR